MKKNSMKVSAKILLLKKKWDMKKQSKAISVGIADLVELNDISKMKM